MMQGSACSERVHCAELDAVCLSLPKALPCIEFPDFLTVVKRVTVCGVSLTYKLSIQGCTQSTSCRYPAVCSQPCYWT